MTETNEPKVQAQLSIQDRSALKIEEDSPLIFYLAQLGDEIPLRPGLRRDKALDKFWKTESILAGAIYSMCAKVAALDFRLSGKAKAVARYANLFQAADFGTGWVTFIQKVVQDILTQDNGAFIELLRPKGASPHSPVRGIAHLDAQRIQRTGNPITPYLYHSKKDSKWHRLKWYQVLAVTDQPNPREDAKGRGYCAVSRVLEFAKLMRAIQTYQSQKLSGQRIPAILFVQGLRRNAVAAAVEKAQEEAKSTGRSLYISPIIISSHDSQRPLRVQLIELAGLPDGFSYDELMKWYIGVLALGMGTDYIEFFPMPGGGLGSAQQTTEMSSRSRGKGPGIILQQFEFGFNWYVLPQTVKFQFASTDPTAERERVELGVWRARRRGEMVKSGEITGEQALRIAVQEGDAPETFLSGIDEDEDRVDVLVKSLQEIKNSYNKVESILCRLTA